MARISRTLPPEQLPLLITGINGVAGYNAFHYFQLRHPGQVIGIRPRRNFRASSADILPVDIEDRSGVRELFGRYRFRSVLNAVGNCALKSCELDPAMAHQLNVASATNITESVELFGCRLVHLSSDLVFSGNGPGGYLESAAVDPVTVYGKTMVMSEEIVEHRIAEAAILRISLPMGPSFNHHAGAIDWIQSRFRAGRPATLYFDEVRSCTYTDDLNQVFEFFLAGVARGLFHTGGPRPMTLFQIGQIVNRVGGFDPHLLRGCPRLEAGPIPPRAGNVSMNSAKLKSLLGHNPFRPWPADGNLLPTNRDWHFHRPAGETGSIRRIMEKLYHYGPAHAEVATHNT